MLQIKVSKLVWFKAALIVLLLLCLFNLPYWYFQLVRIFGTIGFVYLAYFDYMNNIRFTPYIFGVAAIILNPIVKISFGREIWNTVDIVLALLLFASIFIKSANLNSKKTNKIYL